MAAWDACHGPSRSPSPCPSGAVSGTPAVITAARGEAAREVFGDALRATTGLTVALVLVLREDS